MKVDKLSPNMNFGNTMNTEIIIRRINSLIDKVDEIESKVNDILSENEKKTQKEEK